MDDAAAETQFSRQVLFRNDTDSAPLATAYQRLPQGIGQEAGLCISHLRKHALFTTAAFVTRQSRIENHHADIQGAIPGGWAVSHVQVSRCHPHNGQLGGILWRLWSLRRTIRCAGGQSGQQEDRENLDGAIHGDQDERRVQIFPRDRVYSH